MIDFAMVKAPGYGAQKTYDEGSANKELRRLVPEEVLVRAVYHPMAMMELIYNLTEAIMDQLAANRVAVLKKQTRELRMLNREYRKELYGREASIVIDTFLKFYESWYDQKVILFINEWVYAYQRLVMNRTKYSGNTANFIAVMLVTCAIIDYCGEYDDMISEEMRGYLSGSGLRWGYVGSSYINQIKPMAAGVMREFGVSGDMEDDNTRNGLGAFKNSLESICITLVDLGSNGENFKIIE